MSGNRDGALKTAAVRVGISLTDYLAKVAGGEKWCTGCKTWHQLSEFAADRARGDGVRARCLAADRGKPHTRRYPERDAARTAVMYAVRRGELPHQDSVPCTDCSHMGSDRRHEYDHNEGYAPEHHLSVQVVCTLCHAVRGLCGERRDTNGNTVEFCIYP